MILILNILINSPLISLRRSVKKSSKSFNSRDTPEGRNLMVFPSAIQSFSGVLFLLSFSLPSRNCKLGRRFLLYCHSLTVSSDNPNEDIGLSSKDTWG